ncbi:MAG: hypothetical protein IT372_03760 [Polyangiaceae bacterium]|nr:hypothetical protein [Polyangiaceae bacterium]
MGINVKKAVPASDPDLTKALKQNRPEVAKPTGDPDRYTIFVPSEKTTFSLGQKCPTRIHDVGITGRTDNHIHWHVQTNNKTLVSLGSGATEVSIASHDATVPQQSTGYAMVTDQHAWHDSMLQHFIVSRSEDVVIRAAASGPKTALLQSDHGNVGVAAGQVLSMGSQGNVKIVADPGVTLDQPVYSTAVPGKLTESFNIKTEKNALAISDMITSAYSLIGGIIKVNGKDPPWKKPEWKPTTNMDVIKVLVDFGKLASSVARYFHSSDKDTKGKVDILGANYASMGAGIASSIYGRLSASVSSDVSASLLGGTAGVKGLLWASLWSAAGTSVKAGTDVSVEGEFGKASLKGRKDVSIASTVAGVKIQGEKDTQISAKSGRTYVYGKTGVYCSVGGGAGYGFKVKPSTIEIAKITSSANKFDSTSLDKEKMVKIDDKVISLQHGSSHIKIQPRNIKFQSKGDCWVQVDNMGKMTTKASKILLG